MTPDDDLGESLGDLYDAELAGNAEVLDRGLAELAAGAATDLEALARAAHTIRGAAQIVGLTAAGDAARAMEEAFGAARAGAAWIGPASVGALQRLVGLLRQTAGRAEHGAEGWQAEHGTELAALRAELARLPPRLAAAAPPSSEPPSPPPPAAPRATGSMSALTDASLLELFRQETEAHAAALAQGLLALERDPRHTDQLNQLMRAAHSIKGAARIVNADAAVGLAHVMEDGFLAALDGRVLLRSDDIDLMLRGADTLLEIAALDGPAPAEVQRGVAELASRIEAIGRRPPAEHLVPADGAPAPAPSAADVDPGGAARPPGLADRAVRVTVQNINRLMHLAGESLVEARRLDPFAGELHKLAVRQSGLLDQLDQLDQILQDAVVDERAFAVLAEAKARALEGRRSLSARMAEYDAYARRAQDLTGRLYREAIACRMRPFADGLQGFSRMVRDLARKLAKEVELTVSGESVGVDRDILERLEAPLNHMLRNAIDHGLEPPAQRVAAGKPPRGTLRLEARHWAGMLSVTLSDDGRGIDPAIVRERIVARRLADPDVAQGLSDAEVLDYVFVPGFSTAANVTEISGRGVGLDVVRSVVQEVGGSVRISSEVGVGTSIHLQLPITLSVIRAVVVEIAGEPYAFPMMRIDRILSVPLAEVRTLENLQYVMVEDRSVGLVSARRVLDLDGEAAAGPSDAVAVVVLSDRTRLFGVAVDRFLGEHDLVIRPLDPRLGKVADVIAAAVLTDGSPILILDVEDLLRSTVRLLQGRALGKVGPAEAVGRTHKRVLVVDDSITVREVQRQILVNHGYEVDVAVDGLDGWHLVRNRDFDLVISDVDMPRMNGIELVKSIKQDPRLRDVPVMIVSYKDRAEDRRRGLEAGADYYLTKSEFHDQALVHAVVDLIGDPT